MHLGVLYYLFQYKKLFEALMSLKYAPVRCKTMPITASENSLGTI